MPTQQQMNEANALSWMLSWCVVFGLLFLVDLIATWIRGQ